MSHEAIAFVKSLVVPTSSHKLLLMALAERISNETGECWPSQSLLARECSKSERQIRYIVSNLEEAGVISRRARKKTNGHRDSDAYSITGFGLWLSMVESLKVSDAEAATRKLAEMQATRNAKENPTGNGLPVGPEIGNPTGNGLPVANRQWAAGEPSRGNPHRSLARFTRSLAAASERDGKNGQGKKTGASNSASQPSANRGRSKKQQELFKADAELSAEAANAAEQALIDAKRNEERLAFEAYNDLAKDFGLRRMPRLTAGIRGMLRQALDLEGSWPMPNGAEQYGRLGLSGWLSMMARVRKSSFATGRISDFKVNLELLMSETGIAKVMSGIYDDWNVGGKPPSGPNFSGKQWRTRMRIWDDKGRKVGVWPIAEWGPPPGDPECVVPPEILAEFDISNAA